MMRRSTELPEGTRPEPGDYVVRVSVQDSPDHSAFWSSGETVLRGETAREDAIEYVEIHAALYTTKRLDHEIQAARCLSVADMDDMRIPRLTGIPWKIVAEKRRRVNTYTACNFNLFGRGGEASEAHYRTKVTHKLFVRSIRHKGWIDDEEVAEIFETDEEARKALRTLKNALKFNKPAYDIDSGPTWLQATTRAGHGLRAEIRRSED